MLTHLVIRNFAIIEHLEIPVRPGFTVLTGETGAGKSIIIDALNLLLGGRASTEVIRTDEDEAIVQGVFEPSAITAERLRQRLAEQGIDFEGQLIIRRILSRSGRNKVFVNGSLTTLANLASLARGLVDISGQHEHYSLLRADEHIGLLDAFAGLSEQVATMGAAYSQVNTLKRELKALHENVRDRLHRADFLRFQLVEIDAAELEPGEEEKHEAEVDRLRYAEKINDAVRSALRHTYAGQDSAVERLGEAVDALKRAARYDTRLEGLAQRLDEARIAAEETARDLQDQDLDIDADPGRLDTVIERLEVIKKLRQKYGQDIPAILENAAHMREELHRLDNAEEHGHELEARLEKARQKAWVIARKLSQARREAAVELRRRVEAELGDLNMARTQFVPHFSPAELPPTQASEADAAITLDARGFDRLEFLLAPNVGEEPRPMAKIASGGELSRIMLAIKTVLAERDTIDTYVFDEVDTGIGGATADVVGAKIQHAARDHQVLCITHLASIASRSDHHYVVEKMLVDERTQSIIRPLSEEERIDEVARMLGGARVTTTTRDAARELLTQQAR
ncbi:DNA repair protein RecN [Lujinxingia litoralis]|uniref:DNA repair protein RecN n=1 Tax=Lujinxingia litoralis TaxID=2211119 RepID=A0A328C6V7_9DELT|nr:DNA repair protein RecN [Lujinxingia litoralis]RAL22194.1 DNA repair protein RecN [Lujinxingia litoralis]